MIDPNTPITEIFKGHADVLTHRAKHLTFGGLKELQKYTFRDPSVDLSKLHGVDLVDINSIVQAYNLTASEPQTALEGDACCCCTCTPCCTCC